MIQLQNICNAFVRLELGEHVLICDPWLTSGIFDGGWTPFPPIQDPDAAIAGVTHCFISHIHEDHCDFGVIDRLPRTTHMFVPEIFPNHVIVGRLRRLGFENIRLLKPCESVAVAEDLAFEVVPPMNGFAMETQFYGSGDRPPIAIDSGLIVTFGGVRVVLLADNSPYNLEAAGSSLERMKHADLLAIPYNGFADDYPVCYDNLSLSEKKAASLRRSEKRFQLQVATLQTLKPKCLMPYSSDFAVRGRRAREFVAVHPAEWFDKQSVAERYSAMLGIPAIALYESDRAVWNGSSWKVEGQSSHGPLLQDYADSLSALEPTVDIDRKSEQSWETLLRDLEESSLHMFEFLDKTKAQSEWILSFYISDFQKRIAIDLKERTVFVGEAPGRKRLECNITSGYLSDHLEFRRHWNNSVISYNLSWQRQPDEFDYTLATSLNFLHKPVRRPAAVS